MPKSVQRFLAKYRDKTKTWSMMAVRFKRIMLKQRKAGAMAEPVSKPTDDSQRYSFEEFRLMYESTERISERKLNFNRSNMTICLAIIAGIGASISWTYGKADFKLLLPVVIFFISFLSTIFCMHWLGQLHAFKDLNTAKFSVLNIMADKIAFPDYKNDSVKSINPFQLEYEILEDRKKLDEKNGVKFLKSTIAETFVPKLFIFFFVTICIYCAYRAGVAAGLLQDVGL